MPEARNAAVCLVTPGHLSTNPRLVKEADALQGAGYRVSVVSSRFIGWGDAADEEFVARPWFPKERVAFGPLAGGVSRVRMGLRRRAARSLWELSPSSSLALALNAFHPVIPDLSRAAARVPADLYIAHNLAALPAAVHAAHRHGGLVGFDCEDYHAGELPEGPRFERARALVKRIEEEFLPLCRHVTAASPGIAECYGREYGIRRPVVVRNTFPLAEAPASPVPPPEIPSVYWFSQTIGRGRGLETAVRALALTRSRPDLVLRGNADPAFMTFLDRVANEAGVRSRVRIEPPLSPGEIARDASRHSIGLAGEEGSSANNELALSNKLFAYLLAGIPVVASDTSAQVAFAKEADGAVVVYRRNDAEDLARSLDAMLAAPALSAARARAWCLARERFCWDLERDAFLESVSRCLAEA